MPLTAYMCMYGAGLCMKKKNADWLAMVNSRDLYELPVISSSSHGATVVTVILMLLSNA